MLLDVTQLATFRSRFEAKEPDPKNFIRKVTKFDFYLTVEDLVEERRSKGYAWEGIAEDFAALGIDMKLSTLKTCFRRARLRKRGAPAGGRRPPRPGHPNRRTRSNTPLPSLEAQTATPPPAESAGLTTLDSPTPEALVDVASKAIDAALPPEESNGARPEAPKVAATVATPDPVASGSRDRADSEEDTEGGREEMVAALPARDDASDSVVEQRNGAAVGSRAPEQPPPRRVYRSTITIRPEKPLSAFKENT